MRINFKIIFSNSIKNDTRISKIGKICPKKKMERLRLSVYIPVLV